MSQTPERSATVVDGVYVLKKTLGEGGMAKVFLAAVDLNRFDYTTLYAYTQVQGDSHTERLRKAKDLAVKLKDENLDLATIRRVLELQGIPLPGPQVALKVGLGGVSRERFESEWTHLLCLNHENVVKVYGGGVYSKRPYYALELLEHIVPSKRIVAEFSLLNKIRVVLQAGSGLAYLHGKGIVHRDMKPDNAITVEIPDGTHRTVVTDLGLAKNMDEDLGMTNTQTMMGTPYFMSPEQMRSAKDVDHRTDIYSLGATLYELVTRMKPYHDKSSVMEIFQTAARGERPIPPERHVEGLPAHIAEIIKAAMGFEVEDRYQTMREFLEDLEAFASSEQKGLSTSLHFDQFKAAAPQGNRDWHYRKYLNRRKPPKLTLKGQLSTRLPATQARPAAAAPAGERPPEWWRQKPYLVAGAAAAVAVVALAALLVGRGDHPHPDHAPPVPAAPPAQPQAKTPPPAAAPAYASVDKVTFDAWNAKVKAALGVELERSVVNGVAVVKCSLSTKPQTSDISVLKGMRLWSLDLGNTNVTDLSPLKGMPLRGLNLYGCKATDFSPLQGMPLTDLYLWNCTRFADLGLLQGMPLTTLNLNGTDIMDLSPLKGMPLTTLNVSGCPLLTDLGPLKGMRLEVLGLSFSKISDLSPLVGMPLTEIGMMGCGAISDLGPLKGMPLKKLEISQNYNIRDLRPLSGMPLTNLNLAFCYKLADLGPLKGLPLTSLSLACSPLVADLTPLAGMPLTSLDLCGTSVTDLSPLKGMPLTSLTLHSLKVTDLSPLKGLPLTSLGLRETKVADLSPLKGLPLTSLGLRETKVADLSPLKGLPLTELDVIGCAKIADLGPLSDITLTKIGITPHLLPPGWQDVLKRMGSLKSIHTRNEENGQSTAQFWKNYEAGMYDVVDQPTFDAWNAKVKAAYGVELQRTNDNGRQGAVLSLQDKEQVTDLGLLKGMRLMKLNLSHCPRITDIRPLEGMPLTELHMGEDTIADLSPLKGMRLLTKLHLPTSDQPGDLSALAGLPLTFLHVGGRPVSDLSPLKGMPLSYLVFDKSPVADLSPLKGMPLKILNMAGTRVTDLSPVKDAPLTFLHFSPHLLAPGWQDIVKKIGTLQVLGTAWPQEEKQTPEQFWKNHAAGKYTKENFNVQKGNYER